MDKSPDAFRTISEVAEWLGVQAHVLRFWESKFTQVKPVKRAGGRRYYRPADMQLLGGIKTLLHDDGLTIKGVQKILREQGIAHVAAQSPAPDDPLGLPSPARRGKDNVVALDPAGRTGSRDAAGIGPESDPDPSTAQDAPAGEADDDGEAEQALPDQSRFGFVDDAPQAVSPPEEEAAAPQEAAEVPGDPKPEPTASDDDTTPPEMAQVGDEPPPSLPSFVAKRRGRPAPDLPAPDSDPEMVAPAKAAAPRIVDAPDPPEESLLPAQSGILSALARARRPDPRHTDRIAALAQALRRARPPRDGKPGA